MLFALIETKNLTQVFRKAANFEFSLFYLVIGILFGLG